MGCASCFSEQSQGQWHIQLLIEDYELFKIYATIALGIYILEVLQQEGIDICRLDIFLRVSHNRNIMHVANA